MKSLKISDENMDYIKSMRDDAEAEDGFRYSLNVMISRLIEDREELMAK